MAHRHLGLLLVFLLFVPAAAHAASDINSPDESHGQTPGQVATTVTPPKSPSLGLAPARATTATATINLPVHLPQLHLGSVRMGPFIPDNIAIGIKFALDL